MAARVGARAQGTDGSDYTHREQVARRYQTSAVMKSKLKRVLQVQLLCAAVCLAVGVLVKYDTPSLLCFAGYLCGIPMCYAALQRNSVTLINLYGTACSLFGVLPMFYTLYLSLWTGALTTYRYVRLAEAVVVIVVNMGGMYFAKALMEAWTSRTELKRQ